MVKKHNKDKVTRAKRDAISPRRLIQSINKAGALIEEEQWGEAIILLEKLNKQNPDDQNILAMLAECYYELDNLPMYQWTLERVIRVERNDPDLVLSLAGACLANMAPAHALVNFNIFMERWPDHPMADEVKQAATQVEQELKGNNDLEIDDFEQGFQLALQHEKMLQLISRGEYPQALVVGGEILRKFPRFQPAMNNISEVYWLQGKQQQAVDKAKEVLELDVENAYSHSLLIKFYCLMGQENQARKHVDHLFSLNLESQEIFLKAMQSLSYLGDDSGVLKLFEQAILVSDFDVSENYSAFIYHLAAVAFYRVGDRDQANKCWMKALEIFPSFHLALENISDLENPVSEQHAPWAFSLSEWLTPGLMDRFSQLVNSVLKTTVEKRIERSTRRFLERNPEIFPMVPLLLDRGDETGREFALALARMVEKPDILLKLKDFTLGQRGPDQMRMECSQILVQEGILPGGMTRMWIDGKWIDVLLVGIELHGRPLPGVDDARAKYLLENAIYALHAGDGRVAQENLQEAISLEPDAPVLHYNLAGAYQAQGNQEQALELIEDVHKRFPDYLFARTSYASHLARQGEIKRAKDLLAPLMSREKMHFSEFDAFCGAQLELHLADKDWSGARSWFGLWESVDPSNPKLDHFRMRVSPLDFLKSE